MGDVVMVRLPRQILGLLFVVACCIVVSRGWKQYSTTVDISTLKDYCVVDLTGNGDKYAVTYLDVPPSNGWGMEYKTDKLVLRLIKPGKFKFRGRYDAEVTKCYYIGVYEVTCRQYALVTGKDSKEPFDYAVDWSAWWEIRGNPLGAAENELKDINWPHSRKVHPLSFCGRLSSKTGVRFDLPTEFQWEYACGTESDMVCQVNDILVVGKFPCECKYENFPDFRVGTKLPNKWGLYDMLGNVSEWCRDPFDLDYTPASKDAVGSFNSDGEVRVVKGGSIRDEPKDCVSTVVCPFSTFLEFTNCIGFRVVMEVE